MERIGKVGSAHHPCHSRALLISLSVCPCPSPCLSLPSLSLPPSLSIPPSLPSSLTRTHPRAQELFRRRYSAALRSAQGTVARALLRVRPAAQVLYLPLTIMPPCFCRAVAANASLRKWSKAVRLGLRWRARTRNWSTRRPAGQTRRPPAGASDPLGGPSPPLTISRSA